MDHERRIAGEEEVEAVQAAPGTGTSSTLHADPGTTEGRRVIVQVQYLSSQYAHTHMRHVVCVALPVWCRGSTNARRVSRCCCVHVLRRRRRWRRQDFFAKHSAAVLVVFSGRSDLSKTVEALVASADFASAMTNLEKHTRMVEMRSSNHMWTCLSPRDGDGYTGAPHVTRPKVSKT